MLALLMKPFHSGRKKIYILIWKLYRCFFPRQFLLEVTICGNICELFARPYPVLGKYYLIFRNIFLVVLNTNRQNLYHSSHTLTFKSGLSCHVIEKWWIISSFITTWLVNNNRVNTSIVNSGMFPFQFENS